MTDVQTNRCSLTLAVAITSSTQTAITRTSATNGLPGDSNGPASGTYKFVMTDGAGNYEIAQVTDGQGTTSLTISRAVELIGGVQTALSSVPNGTVCYAVRTAAEDVLVEVGISGNGAVIASGVVLDVELPCYGTITGWQLMADESGSIVVDLWKAAYSGFPPTSADSICGTALPTLSSAVTAQSTTLTGWTTAFSAADIIRVNVNSANLVKRVLLALQVTRS